MKQPISSDLADEYIANLRHGSVALGFTGRRVVSYGRATNPPAISTTTTAQMENGVGCAVLLDDWQAPSLCGNLSWAD
jgi:hypothetical protein